MKWTCWLKYQITSYVEQKLVYKVSKSSISCKPTKIRVTSDFLSFSLFRVQVILCDVILSHLFSKMPLIC